MPIRSDYRARPEPAAPNAFLWVGAAVLVVAVAAFLYFQRERPEVAPEVPLAVEPPAPPAVPMTAGEPEIRYPIPETPPQAAPEEPPLPSLNESDTLIQESLARLFGQESLSRFLIPKEIIRRIVATVDNLPREKIAARLKPVSPIAGKFLTAGPENTMTLSPENYARYTPFVSLVGAVDAAQLAAVYFRLYPLFQEAYVDLGYPSGYFNDRLIEVIDHLLATPDVRDPIKLVRPSVYYKFADPALEARSAGQKTLIRMGSENALAVKARLYEIRREVSGRTPKPQ
ncbi:MAG: DUF3014 domain-containing protein [Gammaproteobacteria bacterium]|nr:DUF3014 domain-containing protein [Gammaproteobacteria bacterium]